MTGTDRAQVWRCPHCGLVLHDVLLPVRHACKLAPVATGVTPPDTSLCIHRGEILERIVCRGCGGAKEVDVYQCAIHGRSHRVPANDHRAGMSCTACAMADEGFEPPKLEG